MGDDAKEVGEGQIMMTLFANLRHLNSTLKALEKDFKQKSDIFRSITATRQLDDPQMAHIFSICPLSFPYLESFKS